MPFEPLDAAKSCIRRSRRFLALANGELPDAQIKNDLRRTAVVMSVAAIDAYMHWLIHRRVTEVHREGDLPKSLARFDIAFDDLACLADAAIEAQRKKRKIRPWVQVKNALQKRLLKETFQSYEQVGMGFSLAGIEKGWSRVAGKLHENSEGIRTRLNRLVHRRNQIVHEGDIARASRPQKIKYNAIDHASTEAEINWVKALITAIEEVVNEGNPA